MKQKVMSIEEEARLLEVMEGARARSAPLPTNGNGVTYKALIGLVISLLAVIGSIGAYTLGQHEMSDTQQFSANAQTLQNTANLLSVINEKLDRLTVEVTQVQTTQKIINNKL